MCWSFLLILSLSFYSVKGSPLVGDVTNLQTCVDVCTSCNGLATFENGLCQCAVGDGKNQECVERMTRSAEKLGLEFISCDTANDGRQARCIQSNKLSTVLGQNHIENVAKYFEGGGPMTGSVFKGSNHLDSEPDCVGWKKPIQYQTIKPTPCPGVGAPRIITQPKDTLPKLECLPKPKPDCDTSVAMKIPQNGPVVGDISPVITEGKPIDESLEVTNKDECQENDTNPLQQYNNFLTTLTQQLTQQPLLGIPRALSDISNSPTFQNFINSIFSKIANATQPIIDNARKNLDNSIYQMSPPNSIVSMPNPSTPRVPYVGASPPVSNPMMQPFSIYPGHIFPGVNGGYFYHIPAPSFIMAPPIYPFYNNINNQENIPESALGAINLDLLPTNGKRICRKSPINARDVKKVGQMNLEKIKVTSPSTLIQQPLNPINVLRNAKPAVPLGTLNTLKPVITPNINKLKIGLAPKPPTILTANTLDRSKIGVTLKPTLQLTTNILDKLRIGLTTAKPKVILPTISRLGIVRLSTKRPTMLTNTNLQPKLELPKT